MNKYRRFKYPFGGETPEEFADARRAYYENTGNTAMQAINATPVVNANTVTQPIDETSPREFLRQYTERVRPEVERRVNEMNRRPSGNGRIIRNHDKLYDYYKDGDKLYYRKKGGKNWIDISDNDVAQKRINATIARNKRTYDKPKTSSDEYTSEEMRAQGFVQNNKGYWVKPQDLESDKTYDAGTLNDVVVTGTRRNKSSNPKRVQGASNYNQRYSIYGDKYAPKNKNNESRYSDVDSDYLLRNLNPGAQSYDRITHIVNKMRRNQVKIPEAKIKDWGFYFNGFNRIPQPTGARGAVVKATPSKWRGKY